MNAKNIAAASEQWSRRMSAGSLLASYVLSFLLGAAIFSVFSGPFGATVALIGMVIAAPMLVVALWVLIIFHASIRAHLALWCLAGPFVVESFWATFRYVAGGRFDVNFLTFVTRNATSDGLLVFGFASAAAVLFYLFEGGAKVLRS